MFRYFNMVPFSFGRRQYQKRFRLRMSIFDDEAADRAREQVPVFEWRTIAP